MRVANGFTFFWKRTPLSNWHVGNPFTVDGVTFRTSEHYMMYKKAELFGDTAMMAIMLNDDNKHPHDVKERGREVFPFDKEKWDAVARDIMFVGIREKFLQNPVILPDLLNTKSTLLVEASPNDSIWGIAMSEDDEGVENPANWKGLNWLGETLTRVRESILNQQPIPGTLSYDAYGKYLFIDNGDGPLMVAEIRGAGRDMPQDAVGDYIVKLWNEAKGKI